MVSKAGCQVIILILKLPEKTNIEYQGMQNMWSGEYFIYTDVSYDMPIHELVDLSKHMHPTGNK